MEVKKYDVIIVGAGPGGLRCAQVLGEVGKKVLLIEKKELVGPKICAGGLTRKAIKYLRDLGLPGDIIEKEFDGIVFRKKRFKTRINFGETFLYTIKRENLGQWQLQKLNDLESVTVKTGASVTEIKEKYIVIDGVQKIEYDFLVGADGSNSNVRRFLDIDTDLFGVAYQYFLPMNNKEYEDIEIILDSKLFHSWYAWIFPYAQVVSIGAGYFPKIMSSKKSMDKFEIWLKDEGIDVGSAKIEAHPINCDYRGFHFDNTFLVGDAAGFTSGFTGEGIYQAMISGDEVAKIIIDSNYRSKEIDELLHEKKIHELMLRIVIFSGPLRNLILYFVVFFVKIPFFGRILLRVLS